MSPVLAVEPATKFELVMNLKTAKALGLTFADLPGVGVHRARHHREPSSRAEPVRARVPEQRGQARPQVAGKDLPEGRGGRRDRRLPLSRPPAHLRVMAGHGECGPAHDQGPRRVEDAQQGAAL